MNHRFIERSERSKSKNAQVAQSVEQRTENPRVGGSIPPLGTIYKKAPQSGAFLYMEFSGPDENRRCGSKAASAAQTAERRPQGEDFD